MGMSANRLQYLESLDSVRSPWQMRERRDIHDLQILMEVVLALALGRTVVVPQAYAFDSLGFLRAARDVLRARESAGVKDSPFRLHLYEAETFDVAIDRMLARIGDGRRPFVSSLFPEFQQPELYGIDRAMLRSRRLTVDSLLTSDWLDDERADLLEVVRRELSGRPRARAKPDASGKPLNVVLAGLIDESSPMIQFVSACPEPVRKVWSDLLDGFAALDPSGSGAFDQRSRIYQDTAWLGDSQQRTAEEILGGPRAARVAPRVPGHALQPGSREFNRHNDARDFHDRSDEGQSATARARYRSGPGSCRLSLGLRGVRAADHCTGRRAGRI
ncbi:hypothetical protein F1D05_35840 [Kribbella qitaiheensis]|uniref:Uncharacterized protein n=1 Tax=Kribbella qitaiheensis TaxID=1544730 RepID=A0A7G6X7T0_9ACTN|nr:hypothetical protein F1D05_35840 [Kribbella qitaiheensis]